MEMELAVLCAVIPANLKDSICNPSGRDSDRAAKAPNLAILTELTISEAAFVTNSRSFSRPFQAARSSPSINLTYPALSVRSPFLAQAGQHSPL